MFQCWLPELALGLPDCEMVARHGHLTKIPIHTLYSNVVASMPAHHVGDWCLTPAQGY